MEQELSEHGRPLWRLWRQFSHSNNEKPLLRTRSEVLQTYDTGTIYTSRIQLRSHLVIAVSAATAVKGVFTFEDFKAGLNAQNPPIATAAQRTVGTVTANQEFQRDPLDPKEKQMFQRGTQKKVLFYEGC